MLVETRKQPFVRNALLASLSMPDFAAMASYLEPIFLKERMILHEPMKRVDHVYFVESGIVSQRIVGAGCLLETALVGYRGAIGISFLLGGHIPTHQSIVLVPGNAMRIHTDNLRRVLDERPQILERLLEYVQALNMHGAQTALCGVRHEVEQRLACWLCLAFDARDQRVLPVTHDYLSTVVGLHRTGITRTLGRFEEQGLIRKMRGALQIDDQKRLQQKACSCYGIIARAYASTTRSCGLVGFSNQLEGDSRLSFRA